MSPQRKNKKSASTPSYRDRLRLALASTVSLGTIRNAYLGISVNPNSRIRIETAASELGLPVPPGSKPVLSKTDIEILREAERRDL